MTQFPLALLAATAIAAASVRILNPVLVEVDVKGRDVSVVEKGAPAPDHNLLIEKDEEGRPRTITWVGY